MKTWKDKLFWITTKLKILKFQIFVKYVSPKLKDVYSEVNTIITTRPDYIIKLQGRLGNQMFQYAFSKCLKGNVLFDRSPLETQKFAKYQLGKFNLNIKTIKTQILADFEEKHKLKSGFGFIDTETIKPPIYLDGYYQNEKYFIEYKDELIKEFTTTAKMTDEYLKMAEKIENSNSVLLNFRVAKDYKIINWTVSYDYQKKAIEYIKERVQNPEFFVFADDINEVKRSFRTDEKLTFVDIGKNNPDKVYLDLELMKKCKYDILTNSSFSFWAGWLNQNPNKIVIAPDPWIQENDGVVPDDWIKIRAEKN